MTDADDPVAPRIVETHTAILFFLGGSTYKLKKPVDLGFVDLTDRRTRLQVCRREVELNRRIAPDVYLGVLDVVDSDGEPVDHLVRMRRMPDDRRLTRCLERGEDTRSALRSIAEAVATLHDTSVPDAEHDRLGHRDSIRRRWTEGFRQLDALGSGRTAEQFDRMERLADRYLAGRGALFDQRVADGRIRDGHGDLQADDIFLLDDGPRILDCVEFGDDYRWGDILSDAAFLAMDLERLGRADLAEGFLVLHGELGGDSWPATLAHHYIAYRAQVRAKVGVVREAQQPEPPGADTQRYIDVALAHLQAAQVRFVLVGGEPGTGKSTLARHLGDALDATVLRTDEIRREDPATDDPGSSPGPNPGTDTDRYTSDAVDATYHEMLTRASRLVGLGEHVVLDATWGSAAHRAAARRAAEESFCDLVELRCVLAPEEADRRIRNRLSEGSDPSEVTPQVAATLRARFEPWPEATEIDTGDEPARVAERARSVVAAATGRVPAEGS